MKVLYCRVSSLEQNTDRQKVNEKDYQLVIEDKCSGVIPFFERNGMTPYKNYINKEIPMMENLLLFYRKSDGKTKKKILSCIFSEKVVLEKGRVATTPFSIPVQVLINTSKVWEGSKNKKETISSLLSIVAPLTEERCNFNTLIEYIKSRVNPPVKLQGVAR